MFNRRQGGAVHLGAQRWRFADCIFDEASWSLKVADRRVHIEAKPLELLRALLAQDGKVVAKDALMSAIWPDVTVVEASLTTAVHKLRAALSDNGRERNIIETVAGIGYRLAVPVEAEGPPAINNGPAAPVDPVGIGLELGAVRRRTWSKAGIALGSIGALLAFFSWSGHSATTNVRSFSQPETVSALRQLDVGRIEQLLAQGWDPNTPIGDEGNASLHYVLEMCEWDRGHDQRRLMLLVRTLHEGGARLDLRNKWGDTPYSIASAPRYCGPDHPATKAIAAACFAGLQSNGDRCLASYQLERRAKR